MVIQILLFSASFLNLISASAWAVNLLKPASAPPPPASAGISAKCARTWLSHRAGLPREDAPGTGIAARYQRIAEKGLAPEELRKVEQKIVELDKVLREREEREDQLFFGTLHPQNRY